MIIYQSVYTNPYWNLATEEYFLRNLDDDVFMLYINEPSVIIGKHQNAVAEINVPYSYEHQIKVARRLSGGGTVYHDSGNLNYCFIQKGAEGHLVDFRKYAQPILDALNGLGLPAYLKGKSDLVIDDLKFSGNAEHVYRNKVLHHGTLLFNSGLTQLGEVLKADWAKFNDRAVRSNRSRVTNILPFLSSPMNMEQFQQMIMGQVTQENSNVKPYFLTNSDKQAIEQLVNDKYSTWEWNFGYSPRYIFSRKFSIQSMEWHIRLTIEKGWIIEAEIQSTTPNGFNFESLQKQLFNQPHSYPIIMDVLNQWIKQNPDTGFTAKELIPAFF